MVSRTVLLVLLSLFCKGNNALHNLFPVDIGLSEEDPFLTNEREAFDDCHTRYMRYGREELEAADPFEPYEEPLDYSHLAEIGWRRTGGPIEWTCIGVLIWDSFVITSARCTTNEGNDTVSVVRLGVQKYVQQSNIKEVIRHPDFSASDGQNDIALLQLERKIVINETAVPACLWLFDDVPFGTLDSVGRQSASRGQQTPAFLTEEVTIQNVKSEDCFSSTTQDRGLPESQFCTKTVEPMNTDECSRTPEGNPLQKRLLHNYKTSPFVVGILSSSFSSGTCNPQRGYTKISHYREWLVQMMLDRNVSVTPQDFFPVVCAHRFGALRPRVDELILERNGEVPINSIQVESVHERNLNYVVQFEWPPEAKNVQQPQCAGTFIDQQTVLTLAECVIPTTPGGIQPTAAIQVTRFRNSSYPIESIIIHPDYMKSSQKNNLAVVKLKASQSIVPVCTWIHGVLPDSRVDLTGSGLASLNYFDNYGFDNDGVFNALVQHATEYYPWENCATELPHQSGNRSYEGFSKNEHLCFRVDEWLVPEVCKDVPGAPIMRYIYRAGVYFKYVYALTVAGSACGYGLPTVAIQLAPHATWLSSVMIDKRSSVSRQDSSDSVIVINPDLKRSDECSNGDGTMGICVPYELCLSTKERLRKGERVTLCTDGTVVCCPWGDIARNSGVDPIRTELDSCEKRYHSIRRQRYAGFSRNESLYTNQAHVAEVGWPQINGRISFECLGYLISPSMVVTTARCLETYPHKPTLVRIGAVQASDPSNYVLQTVRRTRIHDDYDPQTGVNNIALLIFTEPIEINAFHFPGCLYRNNTHLPTRQFVINEDRDMTFFGKVSPLYKSECEQRVTETLAPGQMCLMKAQPEGVFLPRNKCLRTGDAIFWEQSTEEEDVFDVVYLVGLYSHGQCELDKIQFATRIAFYYDWIASNGKQ